MTELFSQGYAKGSWFSFPAWTKILIRDASDPLQWIESGKTGGINVIDMANVFSCSFIATDDLGKLEGDKLQLMGRFDHSDVRGCNLLLG